MASGALSCSHHIDGPKPSVSGVTPPAVCQVQNKTTVDIAGEGLSPLLTGALDKSQLELPKVSLSRVKGIDGASVSDMPVAIPDDPQDPGMSHIRWASKEAMSFDVYPELMLATGLYDVGLANANGNATKLEGSLLAVPAPTVAKISPDVLCGDKDNVVELTGDFFIQSATAKPTVKMGDKSFAPAGMTDCRDLPGSAGFKACKKLTVALATKALAVGVHKITVENPTPVGCGSTEAVNLTIVPEPTLAKIEADLVCTAEGDNVLVATGTGFITIDGVAPKLALAAGTATPLVLDTTASNCTAVMGPLEMVQSCTTLTATLRKGALSPGLYSSVVNNPLPVDCPTKQTVNFLVVPEPSVTTVVSDLGCTAEGEVMVAINGTGFLTVDAKVPTVTMGNLTLTPTPAGCTAVAGPTETVQSCTQLVVTVPKDTPPGAMALTVQNPAPAGCTSNEKASYTIVPAPTVTSVVSEIGCAAEGDVLVTVNGTGFLTVDAKVPTVTMGALTLTPTPASCAAVTGPGETVQSCTQLMVTVPKGTSPAAMPVAVVNPAPAACTTKEKVTYTLVPDPSIASVEPDLGCTAEGAVLVGVKGLGFLNLDGRLPTVTVGGATYPPSLSGCTQVVGPLATVETCTQITISIPKDTAAGALAVTVQNAAPAGCSTKQNATYTIVPAPTVTSVEADTVCAADGDVAIVVKGTGFLAVNGATPTVLVGALALPSTTSGCQSVTGPAGTVSSCTQLQVTVPKGTAAGTMQLGVKNPVPAACTTTPAAAFAVFDRPVITDIKPGASCGQASPVTLVLTGTGFVTADGRAPSVKVGSQVFTPAVAGCTPVVGVARPTQLCTSLTVSIPANTFASGQQAILVTNPSPLGCASNGTSVFDVTTAPAITQVSPAVVCAGAARITLTGTNFSVNATVKLGATTATQVAVSGGTSAVADFPTSLPTGGPFDVTIANAASCSDTKVAAVTVVPGPQVFFVDPEIVYNGITIQATLYGTGFTGVVQSVALRPSGGGAAIPLAFTPDGSRPGVVQIVVPKATAAGQYDVELGDTTACTASLPKGLTITDQATLTLGAQPLTPSFGWAQGATATTVSGSGFQQVPRVYLNPSNPGPSTKAIALGAVTFVSASELSVLVSGLTDTGKYDLIVVNPDGKVGVAQQAFEITQDAPPSINTVSPGSVTNQTSAAFAMTGKDFRSPAVSLRCLDNTGALLAGSQPPATVGSSTATTINATFDAAAASTGGAVACIVRVTDGDNQTFAEFSALVITNPAQNLYPAKNGSDLNVARRAPVALQGDASRSARYLHVIGGDDNAGAAFDTVETAALSLLGQPGSFFLQRSKLKQARTMAGGVNIGRWLYVAGGASGATALASVERAAVLDATKDRGEITGLLLDPSDVKGLGPGVWYYRVSSLLKPTDAFNPTGENLPSDPFPVRLPTVGTKKFVVTLSWKADARAAKYRVYRSKDPGAGVGTEQVVAEVDAAAASFIDDGATPLSTDTPLPIGSTGVWQTLTASLATARQGAGITWAMDPADATKAYLYVIGGKNDTAAQASTEYLPITLNADGSQMPAAAFTAGLNNLASARWQLAAARATSDLSPRIPPGTTYVYALSGVQTNGTTLVTATAAAAVLAGGQLAPWSALDTLSQAGYASLVAGTSVFAFGGLNAAPSTAIRSGEICAAGVGGCGASIAPIIKNWNAGQTMLASRYLMGGTLSGAFIYITGGVTGGSASKSTEYRLW